MISFYKQNHGCLILICESDIPLNGWLLKIRLTVPFIMVLVYNAGERKKNRNPVI